MADYNTKLSHATDGFAVVKTTAKTDIPFSKIIVIATASISAIEFPDNMFPTYTGDAGIVGVSLAAGLELPVFGDSITLTSGTVLLVRR